MRLSIISFTEAGGALNRELCKKLNQLGIEAQGYEKKAVNMSLGQWTEQAFSEKDGLIFLSACGIAVRAIAPFVKDKFTDPAVVVLDEKAGFAVSLLSGHVGGANELARIVAELTGAVPVISTATDVNGRFAVDVFAKENHLFIADRILAKQMSAGILSGRQIPIYIDETVVDRDNIPGELKLFESKEEFLRQRGIKAAVTVQRFASDIDILYLIPKTVTVGIGCRKGISCEALEEKLDSELLKAGIFRESIEKISTIELKKEEEGIKRLAEKLCVPFVWYEKAVLNGLEGEFSCSSFVMDTAGVDSVCERAAVAGSGGMLFLKKQAGNGITVAAARRKTEIRFEKEKTE